MSKYTGVIPAFLERGLYEAEIIPADGIEAGTALTVDENGRVIAKVEGSTRPTIGYAFERLTNETCFIGTARDPVKGYPFYNTDPREMRPAFSQVDYDAEFDKLWAIRPALMRGLYNVNTTANQRKQYVAEVVGIIMKSTRGKANPAHIQDEIKRRQNA